MLQNSLRTYRTKAWSACVEFVQETYGSAMNLNGLNIKEENIFISIGSNYKQQQI